MGPKPRREEINDMRFLTIPEACAIARISRQTLMNGIQEKRFRAYHPAPNKIVFDRDEFIAAIKGRPVQTFEDIEKKMIEQAQRSEEARKSKKDKPISLVDMFVRPHRKARKKSRR